MIMNVGRICRIVKGKDAGKYCAIVSKLGRRDKNFVLIEGIGIKRRKMNTLHLEPLPPVLEIEKSTEADAVIKALNEKGFVN